MHTHTWNRSAVKPLKARRKSLSPLHILPEGSTGQLAHILYSAHWHTNIQINTQTWIDMNPHAHTHSSFQCMHTHTNTQEPGYDMVNWSSWCVVGFGRHPAEPGLEGPPPEEDSLRADVHLRGSFLNPVRLPQPWKERSLTNQFLPD